jgi:glycopeptide antibiotics resistance protein
MIRVMDIRANTLILVVMGYAGTAAKKIAVIIPVFILTVFFLYAQYNNLYRHGSEKRLWAFILTIVLLYAWILTGVLRRTQHNFFQCLLQSSFYVYVFAVLTLTGYFILFKEVSSHGWWDKVLHRLDTRNRVNLVPFQMFKIYKTLDKQVVGNFVMLLPLGIYLPLMYKRIKGFFPVAIVSLMVSVSIELMQLATSYRSTDIDDVMLNTSGACVGFILFAIVRAMVAQKPVAATPMQ